MKVRNKRIISRFDEILGTKASKLSLDGVEKLFQQYLKVF